MISCLFCNCSKISKELEIKGFKFWKVQLHSNQYYLGRSIILLNEHKEDLFELNQDERDELFFIGEKLNNTITQVFYPDLFNYSSLGNEVRHLHLHVVPRYSSVRKFEGTKFEDKNFGKNYSPYDKNFKISSRLLKKIKDEITMVLESEKF